MQQAQSLRILSIGDCNTSGLETFSVPSVLVDKLTQRGYHCALQNLGEAMNTSREGAAKAQALASPADLVLINFGLVDAWTTSIPWLYISYFPDNRLKRLSRKLLKSVKKRLRGPTARKLLSSGPVVPLHEFTNNIMVIIQHIRGQNPDATIVLWGTAPSSDEERNHRLVSYDLQLAEIAGQEGLFLDTKALLEPYGRQQTYQDAVHLSHTGCDLIADGILGLLPQTNLLTDAK